MPQEFQAVVLAAGRGTRLPEILSNTPKCLLYVGPYPLVWYPLNLLQKHNFQEAIVVVLENEKSKIQSALELTPLKIKIDFATIPNDNDFGTADSLRYISDKIKYDFLVISCDTISNTDLYPLINKFRQHSAVLVSLLFQGGFECSVMLPGPKTKYKPERDLIGIQPDTERLLFLSSASDFDDHVHVSGHLLRKNGKILFYSRLVDAHIYIMKKWILRFLKKLESISTLKGEFLPYLVKKQMINPLKSNSAPVMTDTYSETEENKFQKSNIIDFVPTSLLDEELLKITLYNDNEWNPIYNGDVLRCYAVKAPNNSFNIRVNTTLNYFAVNAKIASIWPLITHGNNYPLISTHASIKSTQMKDIAAACYANLSEKTSLNYSVFNSNCIIQPKNIINRSLIMDGAIVEECCNIENCIIGPKAVIKRGSKLKNCLIGADYEVENDSILECKHLTHSDGFMEIDIQ